MMVCYELTSNASPRLKDQAPDSWLIKPTAIQGDYRAMQWPRNAIAAHADAVASMLDSLT